MATARIFEVISDKFKVIGFYTAGNDVQQWITAFICTFRMNEFRCRLKKMATTRTFFFLHFFIYFQDYNA